MFDELQMLIKALGAEQTDYALCGGLAMAVHAFPRSTLDIDLLVPINALESAKKIARKLGFTFDGGILEFNGGEIIIHRLTKTDQSEFLTVDFLLVRECFQSVWDTRLEIDTDFGPISVVSVQGLIDMKSLRMSGQDKDDIENLRGLIDEN